MASGSETCSPMDMILRFLADQNELPPERLHELIQLVKLETGSKPEVVDQLFDISRTFDVDYIESIYSQLSLNESKLQVKSTDPIGYANPNHPITINGIGIENLNGIYSSSAHLYHAIQVHLLGRPDLVERVKDSPNPYKDSYIKDTGDNVDPLAFLAWKAIEFDVAFKIERLKIIQNPPLARELLATGSVELISPHPPYWGYDRDLDESNMTGKILMIIREDLRRRIYQ